MKTKLVRLNVNLFFAVPENYEVTDTETIEHVKDITLHDANGDEIAEGAKRHESIETVDMMDLGDE